MDSQKSKILGENAIFNQKTFFWIVNLWYLSLDTNSSHLRCHFGTDSCM